MQRVIGFQYDRINAELKDNLKGKNIKAKANINLKDVTQEKIEFVPKDQTALKFKFEFTIDYNPNIAQILFSGFVLGELDKNKAKEVMKMWKTKKIPEEVKLPLFNFILTKCSMRALRFEEEFGLPPHIALPRITSKDSKKIGYTG